MKWMCWITKLLRFKLKRLWGNYSHWKINLKAERLFPMNRRNWRRISLKHTACLFLFKWSLQECLIFSLIYWPIGPRIEKCWNSSRQKKSAYIQPVFVSVTIMVDSKIKFLSIFSKKKREKLYQTFLGKYSRI